MTSHHPTQRPARARRRAHWHSPLTCRVYGSYPGRSSPRGPAGAVTWSGSRRKYRPRVSWQPVKEPVTAGVSLLFANVNVNAPPSALFQSTGASSSATLLSLFPKINSFHTCMFPLFRPQAHTHIYIYI